MEFAAAALTTIAATAAEVGTTAVAAASAASSFLPAASTVGSILSGSATVLSVLGNMRAGEAKARSLELAADDAEMDAKVAEVQTIERRAGLKRALVQAIGERDVAAAASGVDLSFGTPAVARGEAVEDSERALALEDSTLAFNRARLFERAASYRRMASESRAGGLGRAAVAGLEGGAKLLRRG